MKAKQEFAKILYVSGDLSGKLIAERVGTTQKTISSWVTKGNWRELRRRLLNSKEQQINSLYDQLENLHNAIKDKEEGKQFADTKEADVIIKLTASINNLEQDLGLAEKIEAGIQFIKYLQTTENFKTVTEVADLWNNFVNTQVKAL